MKKFSALILLLLALSLSGCRKDEPAKDGTYRAQLSDTSTADNNGWQEYLEVTWRDGKITQVVFDAADESGRLKSQLSEEEYPMDPHPSLWMPRLAEQVKNAQSPETIEGIAGATRSSRHVRAMFQELEDRAKQGDTSTAVMTISEE